MMSLVTASLSTIVTNQGYCSSHQNQLGRSESKPYVKNTLPLPIKKSSGWLDQMPPNSAYWPKYEGGLSPLGRLGMSYRATRASTQWCLGASLKPWPKAFNVAKPVTLGRKSYSKRPSTTLRG